MPLESDFIAPTGVFEAEDFPGLDLSTALSAWLDEAQTLTDDEGAQKAWVLYRGYKHIAKRLYRDFSTADVEGKGQFRRIKEQMKYFDGLAEEALEEYEEITAGDEGLFSTRRQTTVVSKSVTW